MRIVGQAEIQQAKARFDAEWRKLHPAVSPPPIFSEATPAQKADPLWREAEELFRHLQVEALPPAVEQPVSPMWTVLAGGLVCPNNHHVDLTAHVCAGCGLPVPALAAMQAKEKLESLNDHAGLSWLRNQRDPS